MRLSLPSKGRLADDVIPFLTECGLRVYKANPRQYEARIPALPELIVLFQRPTDIVVSVRDGSVAFESRVLTLSKKWLAIILMFLFYTIFRLGQCSLTLAVQKYGWMFKGSGSPATQSRIQSSLRNCNKYPNLTSKFLSDRNIPHSLITAEGTLETRRQLVCRYDFRSSFSGKPCG
jgi:ATP phosphoribosyltransferase